MINQRNQKNMKEYDILKGHISSIISSGRISMNSQGMKDLERIYEQNFYTTCVILFGAACP